MEVSLEVALAQIRWPVPHHIPAINEDYVYEELLISLECPSLGGLPHVRTVQDLGLPIQDQGRRPQNQGGPVPRLQPDLHSFTLPAHWPVYEGMDYLGVEEENQEEWDAQQIMEEAEDELELEGVGQEITLTSNTPHDGSVDVSLSTKRPPVVNDKQLLRDINSSTEAHIATISLQEQPMPDNSPPAFVPTLEQAHPLQQH